MHDTETRKTFGGPTFENKRGRQFGGKNRIKFLVFVFEQRNIEIVIPRDESTMTNRTNKGTVSKPALKPMPFCDRVDNAKDQKENFLMQPKQTLGRVNGTNIQLVVKQEQELSVDSAQGLSHARFHRQMVPDYANFGEDVGEDVHLVEKVLQGGFRY